MSDPSPGRIRIIPDVLSEVRREDTIRILHVDDDVDVGELVRDYLESAMGDVEVATESDPSTALERVRSDPEALDCVVSDYRMPGMDGLELLAAVRETVPDLPFILLTGEGSEEVASRAISAGVTDYLRKGGGLERYDALANRIENAVARRRSEGRFRRALQALEWSREGVGLLDGNGRFVYVNYAFGEILGVGRDDLLGTEWEAIHAEGEAERMETQVLPVISRTGRWEGETTLLDGDGDTVVVDTALAFTDDGRLVCMIQPTEEDRAVGDGTTTGR